MGCIFSQQSKRLELSENCYSNYTSGCDECSVIYNNICEEFDQQLIPQGYAEKNFVPNYTFWHKTSQLLNPLCLIKYILKQQYKRNKKIIKHRASLHRLYYPFLLYPLPAQFICKHTGYTRITPRIWLLYLHKNAYMRDLKKRSQAACLETSCSPCLETSCSPCLETCCSSTLSNCNNTEPSLPVSILSQQNMQSFTMSHTENTTSFESQIHTRHMNLLSHTIQRDISTFEIVLQETSDDWVLADLKNASARLSRIEKVV